MDNEQNSMKRKSETILYRNKSRKYLENQEKLKDAIYLKQSLICFKTSIKENFEKSIGRSKVMENLQGLIDYFTKQEQRNGLKKKEDKEHLDLEVSFELVQIDIEENQEILELSRWIEEELGQNNSEIQPEQKQNHD